MYRRIDKSHALIWEDMSIRWVRELSFVVRSDVRKKASQLFPALIWNIAQLADVKVATAEICGRRSNLRDDTAIWIQIDFWQTQKILFIHQNTSNFSIKLSNMVRCFTLCGRRSAIEHWKRIDKQFFPGNWSKQKHKARSIVFWWRAAKNNQ